MNAPEKTWVWLARIRRPQGRKGEVFAEILTDFPEKFGERRHLWLITDEAESVFSFAPRAARSSGSLSAESASPSPGSLASGSTARSAELVHHWPHKGGIVLHFAGVDTISEAETLAGLIVAVPREERVPLAEDEVYIGDLIGCMLIDTAPANGAQNVGEIDAVDRSAGPVPLLIVRRDGREVLVPFAKSYLRRIDLENRQVEMELPQGLLELND